MTSGSCLCGDIAWTQDAPLAWMTHCHCSLCRKAHGTAFSTFVGAPATAFRWTRGEASVQSFASSRVLTRTFCPRCGSKLPVRWQDEVQMPAGALDAELGIRPSKHIFVAAKAPWHEIRDALPQHERSSSSDPDVPAVRVTEPVAGVVRGACSCGEVAYELDAPLEGGGITSCHCTRCRRARGAAHASNLFVALENFRWLHGEARLRSYKIPEAQRFTQAFCGDCGAPLPSVNPARGAAVVPCGSLEDDPGLREARHIFVSSKAPWFEIAGELPQFSAYAPPPFPELARSARARGAARVTS
jgi:hypothetical protein